MSLYFATGLSQFFGNSIFFCDNGVFESAHTPEQSHKRTWPAG